MSAEFTAHEEEEWQKFKEKFKRDYESPEEEQKRKLIFKDNLTRIEEHNKQYEAGKQTYSMGINDFADKLQDEVCCFGKKKK